MPTVRVPEIRGRDLRLAYGTRTPLVVELGGVSEPPGPETPSWSAAGSVHVTGHVPCPTTLYHTRTCHHLPTLLMCLYLLGGHLGLLILTYIRSLVWEARCYDSCGRNACNTRRVGQAARRVLGGQPREAPTARMHPSSQTRVGGSDGQRENTPPLDQRACAKRLKFPDGRGK